MKKKRGIIQLTSKGIAYFAAFWAIVYLIVFGPHGVFEEQSVQPVEGEMIIHFIDVGQADAAVILCGGQVMMIDGGNAEDSSLIFSYLRNTLGISHIDYMIATHPHEDHIGGLSGALNACTVGTVFSPVSEYSSRQFDSLVKYTQQQGKQLTVPSLDTVMMLGKANVQFLSPARTYEDVNDMSIVVRIVFGNTSFLFTGDAEWPAEQDMINSWNALSATLLKVGHHGSDSSTSREFLRRVMPEYAVISVGKGNSYGHPSEDVVSRLRDAGAEVFRTDLNGHIVVTSDGKELSISVQKGGENYTESTAAGWNVGLPAALQNASSDMKRNAIRLFNRLQEAVAMFIRERIGRR